MPLFRRAVPEWASFTGPGEHRAFRADVEAALDGLGVEWRWGDGRVDVVVDGDPVQMGLANVAQQAHAAEPSERRDLVREHFARLVALHGDREREEPAFDDVAAVLKLRVWAKDELPEDVPLVARPVADTLLAVLSIDWPEEVSTVHAEVADAWGRDRDELLELAARNTRAPDPEIETEPLEVEAAPPMVASVGDSFFAASRALWPDEILEPTPDGLLVAFPNRHLAWVCRPENMRVLDVVGWATRFVHDRFVEGPGSISDDLFWWRGPGDWLRLPVEVNKRDVDFYPPDEFVEVLNRLAGEDGSG